MIQRQSIPRRRLPNNTFAANLVLLFPLNENCCIYLLAEFLTEAGFYHDWYSLPCRLPCTARGNTSCHYFPQSHLLILTTISWTTSVAVFSHMVVVFTYFPSIHRLTQK